MPQFEYRARGPSGELVQASIDAADRSTAVARLRQSGLFPLELNAARSASPKGRRTVERQAVTLPRPMRSWMGRTRRPKLQELANYMQQVSNLLKAGMPLTLALNSMTQIASRGISSEVSRRLKADVMEGKSLSDAMARQPVVFSDLCVNMVRAGEQSGALTEVLQRLATHYSRFAEVQQKFKAALIYPAVVCCVGVIIVIFFMTVMLPKFLTIFEGMNVQLPLATRMLIGMSHFFTGYWWVLVLGVLGAVVAFRRYRATPAGQLTIDRWKMRAPVLGSVVRLNLFAQFARTLGTLLHNGVPVLRALRITEDIMPNRLLRESIAKTREEVTDGKTIAQPLARSKVFPQLMIDLIKIGEETGDVPGALNNLADTLENDLTVQLRVMLNLIEPVIIILLAVGVGFLLFSVLSAMFAITGNIAR
ncbi:MAG: type II secretion system F family protein [Verrucomicrobiales bacterium]|nr:type II secretion system F family protein [Verrucomicrobiales bacterium]MCP5527386.1 type II secretion system F family protein [Verrucomicrobiales bacterium]